MTHLSRDLFGPSEAGTSAPTIMPPNSDVSGDLPSPFGELAANLTDSDLRLTAYEIFVLVCRPYLGKQLSNVSNKTMNSVSPKSPSSQRSSGPAKPNQLTVGELMRNQMKVSEAMDFRLRRAFMKLSLEKVLKPMKGVVVPLELLLQLKVSDFTDQEEYEEWHKRALKVLEAGLLLHPRKPLDMSKAAAQRHLQIIDGASDRHILYWTKSENMQALCSAVNYFAWSRYDDNEASDSCHWADGIPSDSCHWADGIPSDSCHWADGIPLNLRLHEMLLQSCFDINDGSSIIVEFDELMEHIEKTWEILGMNRELHNLCFTWVLFHRVVATGQMQASLLHAAHIKLLVARDAKRAKHPEYSKFLSRTLSSILGWSEKRLLAYHETFDRGNVETMRSMVSLDVAAAKIWAESIAIDRRSEDKVARDRIDNYIRSSLRAAFAQIKEKADSSRRELENQQNAFPVLAILAKDVSNLLVNEMQVFSPILKKWHPLAAVVAVAALYGCYAKELRQFISGISELTPDDVRVLRAAHQLEKDVGLIVEEEIEAVDKDAGGLELLLEINIVDAYAAMAISVGHWMERRLDGLKEQVDRNLQLELWSLQGNSDGYAPSAAEVLRMINEILDAFFQLPIGNHYQFLPDLIKGLDRCLQNYVTEAKSGCGSRDTFVPTLPALTRCTTTGRKSQGLGKKEEKSPNLQKGNPQDATNVELILQLCTRINTLQWIQSEFDILGEKIFTLLCNSESGSKGLVMKFEMYPVAFAEGIQQLCEAVGYRIVFHDLRHLLWDGLYIGNPSSSRINLFLAELEQYLTIIPDAVQEKIRARLLTDIMRASFDGFALVLLGGGPSRAFSPQDSQIIEDDFKSLKDLFSTKGDNLPSELIDQFSATVRSVLPLFRTDTGSLIKRFRQVIPETRSYFAESRPPLPPTSGQWDPAEPNTLLRVLCHRNDESASKFLKKTYNLPKNL